MHQNYTAMQQNYTAYVIDCVLQDPKLARWDGLVWNEFKRLAPLPRLQQLAWTAVPFDQRPAYLAPPVNQHHQCTLMGPQLLNTTFQVPRAMQNNPWAIVSVVAEDPTPFQVLFTDNYLLKELNPVHPATPCLLFDSTVDGPALHYPVFPFMSSDVSVAICCSDAAHVVTTLATCTPLPDTRSEGPWDHYIITPPRKNKVVFYNDGGCYCREHEHNPHTFYKERFRIMQELGEQLSAAM